MIHTNIETKTQTDIQILGKIDDFFSKFSIATSLHRCGVRKRHGYSVRSLIMAIFTLPFLQKDFFRGIVINDDLSFGKDAAYEVLKGGHSNWRRLLLSVGIKLYHFFDPLTDENRESVLMPMIALMIAPGQKKSSFFQGYGIIALVNLSRDSEC